MFYHSNHVCISDTIFSKNMTTSKFTYCQINPLDHEEALNLFWNDFMPHEPASRLAGCCTKTGYRIHNLDNMLREMLKNNMCYTAKDEKGELAGVIFCTIYFQTKNNSTKLFTKEEFIHQGWPADFSEVLLLLQELSPFSKIMTTTKTDKILDLFAIVVKNKFRRQGIATQLISCALDKAKSLKIPLVNITCTSSFTQRCSIKLEFSKENSILYKDWKCKDQIIGQENIDPVHSVAVSYLKFVT